MGTTMSEALPPQVGLEVLRNLTHKALEGQLADEQLSTLLIFPDLRADSNTPGARQQKTSALPGGL
jgi:hypothetical protein